jgi:hypothetical protein
VLCGPFTLIVILGLNPQATLVEQFHAASHPGKMAIVSESVLGKRPASDDDIRQMLVAAMKDADASVRRQAVGSIATTLTFSSWPSIPPGQEWTTRMRPVAEGLRADFDAATRDIDPGVRLEALRGVVGPFVSGFGPAHPLPKAIAARMAAVFDTDTAASVRAFALAAVSGSPPSDDPEVRFIAKNVLLRALEQSDPAIVQRAGLIATGPRLPEALPLLVKQLRNPSPLARMGVAQGIASYGAAARSYLPELQAALAAERDDITRKTIAGTISVVSR